MAFQCTCRPACSSSFVCSPAAVGGMQLFPADKQKNPYTKKFDKTPEDYNGAALLERRPDVHASEAYPASRSPAPA